MRKLFILVITSFVLLFLISCNKDDVINNLNANETSEFNYDGNYGEDEYDVGENFGYVRRCCTSAYIEGGLVQSMSDESIVTELAWYGPIEQDVCYLVTHDLKFDIYYSFYRNNDKFIDSINVKTIGNVKINGIDCSNKESINIKNQLEKGTGFYFNVEFEDNAYIRLLNCYDENSTEGYIEDVQELFLIKSPNIFKYDETGKLEKQLNEIPNVKYRCDTIRYDANLNNNYSEVIPTEYDAEIYYDLYLNGLDAPIYCWVKIHVNWDLNTFEYI